jgi:replicative DNA helicase
MCLLGSMMLDVGGATEAMATVSRDAFFQPDHQMIFDAVRSLYDRAKITTAMAVREELMAKQLLEEVGGTAYISSILNTVADASHWAEYARIIKEKYLLRLAIASANDTLRLAYGPMEPGAAAEAIAHQASRLASVAAGDSVREAATIGEIAESVYAGLSRKAPNLIATGFKGIDKVHGGIGDEELWIIAGRPSSGKSTLARQMAMRMSKLDTAVAFVSLEESDAKIGRNALSAEARVFNNKIRNSPLLDEQDFIQLEYAVRALKSLPLYVVTGARTPLKITAALTKLKAKYGVKVAFVDYLQLIQAGGDGDYQRATNSSRFLAELKADLRIPIVATSQLSRAVDAREDRRPTMVDLKSSGQQEQDADAIFGIYREDYYRRGQPGYEPNHVAELITLKFRDGVRDLTINLRSELQFQTFADIDEPDVPNDRQLPDSEPPDFRWH